MMDEDEIDEKNDPRTSDKPPEILDLSNADAMPESALCLSAIDEAIALNKLNADCIQRLQEVLIKRLHECRSKLARIQKSKPNPRNDFKFHNCGMPYFKDKNFEAAPDNEDTLTMKKLEMYDFTMVPTIVGWTVKDKALLTTSILKICQGLKREELRNKIKELKHNLAIGLKFEDNSSISILQAELNSIRKKELKDIVKPLEYEYDWDLIAKQNQNRHSPLAYRGLWKLFLHPSISKHGWAKTEHSKLLKLANQYKLQDWDTIAKELNTNRTGYQCFVYFRTNIKNRLYNSKWSDTEVECLKSLVEQWREGSYIPWAKVAASLKNRTRLQVYQKYIRLNEQNKGRFSAEEDAVLLTCLNKFGEDYQKMKEHLPGRSIIQLRTRSKLISADRRVSAVWTVEEDKRLIKLTGNQDTKMNFSNLTKYFPGKDRTHLRTRFLTLSRWIKKYPNSSIELAPRRLSRNLRNVAVYDDLPSAVQNLQNPSPESNEGKVTKYNKVDNKSSEEAIDRAITVQLHNLHNTDLYQEHIKAHEKRRELRAMENIHNLLILLKASLKREAFMASCKCSKYKTLVELQKKTCITHSKKNPNVAPDIWGNKTFTTDYVLPPNYDTMIGCKKLMSYSKCDWESQPRSHSLKYLENKHLREQFYLLHHRLNVLFQWPMILSNVQTLNFDHI